MRRLLLLSLVVPVGLLLFAVSQTAAEKNKAASPKSQKSTAVRVANLSAPDLPGKFTPSARPERSAAGNPQQTLTKMLQIPRKGITVKYPDDWSVGPKRFANQDELIDVPAGQSASKTLTSKIKITTEDRRNHEEALRRLEEIRIGIGAPETAYLIVGGWPAIQYRRIEERPEPGQDEFRRPQFSDRKMLRITTAVAAGDLLMRLEAALPSNANSELIDKAEAISRSPIFALKANVEQAKRELRQLKERPNSPSADVPAQTASARAVPSTPASGAPATSAGGKGVVLPLKQEPELPPPGLTRRIITGRNGELEIAVSPNGQNIVVGQQSAFRTSNDGGQTFPFNGLINFSGGDPSLAWGQAGNFYYAGIRGGCLPPDMAHPAGYTCSGVARSTNNGQTFPTIFNANQCPNQTQAPAPPLADACFPDQEHIAADRVNAGSGGGDQVYVTWRNFDATDQDPALVCTQDSGANWTAPITVGTDSFPRIGVGQDGFVYVVYLDGGNYMLHKYSSCRTGLNPQAGFPVAVTVRNPITCPFPGHDRCDQNPSSQTVAVDDTNPNHVYFAYARNGGSATNDNVILRDSIDGGLTWPAGRVVQLNPSVPGKRIMPWVCTTGGEAFVTWYDRRAAPSTNNDLTDYYAGRARLDGSGNLVVGTELRLTEVSDPWCASGWPCGTRGTDSSEQCSVQPQLAGFCCSSLDANGNCVGSAARCDFSPDTCSGGETCRNIGGGCPKYGDYNGNACTAGRLFAAWASATSPPSVMPPSTSIDIFTLVSLVGNVPQVQVPGSIAFGDVCVGATATQTLNVCNTGNANLEVNAVNSNNAQFTVTTPTQGYPVVISKDFCFPFQARFTPTSTGAKTATLTIQSNDPALPSVAVQATGTGTQQNISTSIADSGDFGQVCGGSFRDLDLTISNTGGCDLSISNITSSSAEFKTAQTVNFPIVVQGGTSVQVPLRFQPTSIGAKAANITISSNDPDTPNKIVAVSGHSDPGDINVTGSTDFNDVCAGVQSEKTISVCNVGACDLHVTSATINCPDFTIVNNPFPTTVSHDFCIPLIVRFTPTSVGPKMCNLTINSDDPDENPVVLVLKANTPLASIDVAPDQAFPPEVIQSLGMCSTLLPFPILNKGICPVTITNIQTGPGGDSADYGLSALPSLPINLQPGHTVGDGALMTVFSPTVIDRDRLGSLSVTYVSDPFLNLTTMVTRNLCGEGVNTGARVLATASGVPLANVEKIHLQRITGNRNRPKLDTVDNAMNLTLQTVTPASPCAAFQYHREYGTVSNPIQLLPGSYQVTVTAIVNGRRRSLTQGFDVTTCDFNPRVVVDFP